MRADTENSPEVAKFLYLFAELRRQTNSHPEETPNLVETDVATRSLCENLRSAAQALKKSERSRRELFSAPVGTEFRGAWRDYEERYEPVLAEIRATELFADLDFGTAEGKPPSDFDLDWAVADDIAKEHAACLDNAVRFADFNAQQDWRDFPQAEMDEVQEGAAVWARLTGQAGFDLRGFLRRRELVPFVLVPRKVAAKESSADKISLLKSLEQAHEAFNYGLPLAALALMRSIMEAALRDHYEAKGKNLKEMIIHVRDRLPEGASEPALHRLRELANAAIHLDNAKHRGLARMDELDLEKKVLSLLFVLRALIEGVK